MSRWTGRWAGGRTTVDRHGRTSWHLERQVGKVRHRIRLDVESEKGALAELALFERDPDAYLNPPEAVAGDAVLVDERAVASLMRSLAKEGRTKKYRHNVRHYLEKWGEALAGRDFRRVTLAELKAHLAKWGTAERHRIIALKTLAAHLREQTGALLTADDPTLALRVPQARPEKASRQKGWTVEALELVYANVAPQDVRDVLCLRAKSGLHETEVSRIAEGRAVLRAIPEGEIAGTVRLDHKSGRIHVQSLDAQAFDAAVRIAALGAPIDNKRQQREIGKALALANKDRDEPLPRCAPGELRHSFVTWARSLGREVRPTAAGVPLALVAEAIGHTSTRTTSRFYDGTDVPPMIALPLKLTHPADPRPAERRGSEPRPRSGEGAEPSTSPSAAAARSRTRAR